MRRVHGAVITGARHKRIIAVIKRLNRAHPLAGATRSCVVRFETPLQQPAR
jgi:hypothetical protein